MQKLLLTLFLCFSSIANAQFIFSGKVNADFQDATAYLSIVDDCNKKSLFITEAILMEAPVDSVGSFNFQGTILDQKNKIYKIHIDKCNENVTDFKHLMNHCDASREILFIANVNDSIFFPLNDLEQVFCTVSTKKSYHNALLEIDDLHEKLFADLQFSKSDLQRHTIYKNHFLSLQKFAKTFHEPLAELYAFQLYADEKSFSRTAYLKDLKKSNYYKELLLQLKKKYPKSTYLTNYQYALKRDKHPFLDKSAVFSKKTLFIVLFISLLINVLFFYKQFQSKNKIKHKEVDYKKVLTNQEQKVFELMLSQSNKEIAASLFVSVSTVKTHINNIYSKLGIASRREIEHFFNAD